MAEKKVFANSLQKFVAPNRAMKKVWPWVCAILLMVVGSTLVSLGLVWGAQVFQISAILDGIAAPTDGASAPSMSWYLFVNLPIVWLLVCAGVCAMWQQRSWHRFVAPNRCRWDLVALGMVIILALYGALMGASWLLDDFEDIVWSFDPDLFFVFLPLVLVVTPLQVLAEEIIFRGFLVQLLGQWTRNRWVLWLVPAGIFASLHFFNPEMTDNPLAAAAMYTVYGLFLTGLVVRDGRLERAIGFHLGVNLYAAIFVGYENSVLTTPTLWRTTGSIEWENVGYLFGVCAVFWASTAWMNKKFDKISAKI